MSQQTKKNGQPAWVKRILKLLGQAKAKDEDCDRFGADSHQYKLAAPASEEVVQKFEAQHGIRLPEEYRDFLTLVGNGGAGPFYGLFGVKVPESKRRETELLEQWLPDEENTLQAEPLIYPKMSDADWDKAAQSPYPYTGVLPIGTQGCTLMTGLMLTGPYRGQVVYYDDDLCGPPFFLREKGVLAWYERWLREVIAGYDDEETDFGLNVDGNPAQLMELYEQTGDPDEKIEIINSYYKFQTLPGKQKTYFKQACAGESDMRIRMELIKMLAHFQVPGMTKEIDALWEYGAYAEAVSVIQWGSTLDVTKDWYEKVFEILPQLHGEAFRNACYIFRSVRDYPNVNAGRLKDALRREDLDQNELNSMFYCIKELDGKEEVLDYFCDYLPAEEDTYSLLLALEAIEGVTSRRLQEIFVKLLDKYRTHENTKFDYKGSQMVSRSGGCFGASSPEGQIVYVLMRQFDWSGLERREAWRLLMNGGRWQDWKKQNGFS